MSSWGSVVGSAPFLLPPTDTRTTTVRTTAARPGVAQRGAPSSSDPVARPTLEAQAVHEVPYRWVEPSDVVEEVLSLESGAAHDRPRVDYRFRVRNPDGAHLVEQRVYFDLDDQGRIARVNAVCAGFRRL